MRSTVHTAIGGIYGRARQGASRITRIYLLLLRNGSGMLSRMSPTRDIAPDPQPRRILLAAQIGTVFGTELIEGIVSFTRGRCTWLIRQVVFGDVNDEMLERMRPDGIIGLLAHSAITDALLRAKIPAVNLGRERRDMPVPSVYPDDVQIGRLAARHGLEHAFEHFAVIPAGVQAWCEDRVRGYREVIREAGATLHTPGPGISAVDHWQQARPTRLAEWIGGLPKPVFVFSVSNYISVPVMEECQLAGVAVPETVAILGVHNSEQNCALSCPPLSVVDSDQHRMGFEAARMLHALMAGQHVPKAPMLITPRGVLQRQSTDTIACPDPIVREAIQYIRLHASRQIDVAQVAEAMAISRRRLEQRFHQALSRSPLEQIHLERITLARHMLAHGDLTIGQITRRTGFGRADRLGRIFKDTVGMTPSQYRKQFRLR